VQGKFFSGEALAQKHGVAEQFSLHIIHCCAEKLASEVAFKPNSLAWESTVSPCLMFLCTSYTLLYNPGLDAENLRAFGSRMLK